MESGVLPGSTVAITKSTDPSGKHFGGWTAKTEGVEFADASAESTTFIMPAGNVVIAASYFVEVAGAVINDSVPTSRVFISDRTVTINDLLVCDHEVTQAEYEKYCCYGSNPSSQYGLGGSYPVYNTSFYDALVYCNLRSLAEGLTPVYSMSGIQNPAEWTDVGPRNEGGVTKYKGRTSKNNTWNSISMDSTANGYRLPTEAEWEYIARGGNNGIPESQTTYSGSDDVDSVAWYTANSGGKVHLVKTKAPNALGIYDMSGNLDELCWDWYGTIESGTGPEGVEMPVVYNDPSSPESLNAQLHVKKGGRWDKEAALSTVSYRNSCFPSDRKNHLGFRVVRTKTN
ncbi:MAG: SUMF1/EgtB/PvdO family nonheme iron enzyme [Treponemataceae bacterium]|nr:SUMF1/EgtB/PvdO family nonheme iron enzyme [Treponemataceae bacterium]